MVVEVFDVKSCSSSLGNLEFIPLGWRENNKCMLQDILSLCVVIMISLALKPRTDITRWLNSGGLPHHKKNQFSPIFCDLRICHEKMQGLCFHKYLHIPVLFFHRRPKKTTNHKIQTKSECPKVPLIRDHFGRSQDNHYLAALSTIQ